MGSIFNIELPQDAEKNINDFLETGACRRPTIWVNKEKHNAIFANIVKMRRQIERQYGLYLLPPEKENEFRLLDEVTDNALIFKYKSGDR